MQAIDYIRSVGFSLTQGAKFMWNCYGDNSWLLESDGSSAVVDCKTGIVYEVACFNEEDDDCYKWTDPNYIDAYTVESLDRGFNPLQAYDDVEFKQVSEQEILAILEKNHAS